MRRSQRLPTEIVCGSSKTLSSEAGERLAATARSVTLKWCRITSPSTARARSRSKYSFGEIESSCSLMTTPRWPWRQRLAEASYSERSSCATRILLGRTAPVGATAASKARRSEGHGTMAMRDEAIAKKGARSTQRRKSPFACMPMRLVAAPVRDRGSLSLSNRP